MSPSRAALIRRVLNLPRLPKEMSAADRRFYRAVKRAYNAQPSNRREAYLDRAAAVHEAFKRQLKAGATSPAS